MMMKMMRIMKGRIEVINKIRKGKRMEVIRRMMKMKMMRLKKKRDN